MHIRVTHAQPCPLSALTIYTRWERGKKKELRREIFGKLSDLLDERTLLGQGGNNGEIVRPLAYTMLSNVVEAHRRDLSLEDMSKLLLLFARNVHDPTLPLAVQTAAVKVIGMLVEPIGAVMQQQLQQQQQQQQQDGTSNAAAAASGDGRYLCQWSVCMCM